MLMTLVETGVSEDCSARCSARPLWARVPPRARAPPVLIILVVCLAGEDRSLLDRRLRRRWTVVASTAYAGVT